MAVGGCAQEVDGLREAEGDLQPLVDAACTWMFSCCSAGERTFQLGDFTVDADNCTQRMVDAIKAGAPLDLLEPDLSSSRAEGLLVLARSINEGRVSVNDPAVDTCAAATSNRACNTPVEPDQTGRCTPADEQPADPCDPDEMFQGRQKVGQECEAPWECEAGLRCVDFFITGVCAEAAVEGEHCFSDAECANDLVCDYQSGTCVVGALTGQPCAFADPDDPIPGTETTRCAQDLVCDPTSSTCAGGYCTAGAPCFDVFDHTDCPEGTYCVGEAVGTSTCRPPGPEGAPCVEDETCTSGFCDPVDQTCGTKLADGQACFDHLECASGYCDATTQTCAPTLSSGEICDSFSDAQCAGGYCDTTGVDPVCVAHAGEGQPCPNGSECDPEQDLTCVDGSCLVYPLPNGVACFDNTQCESNVCFAGMCADGTPTGSACDLTGGTAPCELGSFCDVPDGEMAGTCTALRRSGEACERSEQCWGDCTVRYGQQMCDETPAYSLGEVWCDGA